MAYSSGYGNPFGFTITPWVKRLILANAIVFLVTGVLFTRLDAYLAFQPMAVLERPWMIYTALTYMFVHAGLFHLLFNMLALFFFGPPLEERWGSREFIKFYLLTGVAGAALSLVFPSYPIVGASAAIYGVLVAFAMYWPDNPIYIWGIFPVKAKWLVGFVVGLSVFYSLTGGQSGVAHLAHLGGALGAFLYLKSPFAPSAWGGGFTPAPRKPEPKKKWRAFLPTSEAPREEARDAAPRPAPRTTTAREDRILDEVDRILDKISESGLNSLTAEERQRLDEASRHFRSN